MGFINICLFVLSVLVLATMRPWLKGFAARHSFVATALLSVCIGLTVPAVYVPIDALLGGRNVANLLLHLLLNVAFYFIGVALADAHLAPRAQRGIAGIAGIAVLTVVLVASTIAFVLSDARGSGPGLVSVHQHQTGITAYVFLNRVYPAYVAGCILVPLIVSVGNRARSRSLRAFSAFMAGAFAITLVSMIIESLQLFGADVGTALDAPTWAAVALFLIGSSVIFADRLLAQRGKQTKVAAEHSTAG